MPRRINGLEPAPILPKKKTKMEEECPSLDVSFFDDEALPPGVVFTDVQLRKWRIGKPIGRGSFGRIYLASDDVDKEVTKQNAKYVVKIEPHTNGPLFVEMHCMIRTAQACKVKAWRQQNKLKRIGMPLFIANGSFTDENTDIKFRFLVLPRYDIDLQKIIARTKILDLKNVLLLSLQILDVLEYLHNQGYTHSDIKSSNLMLGFDGNKFMKTTPSKPTTIFQKESKPVVFLPVKHRKAKTGQSRPSNYYDDEDFTITQKASYGERTINGDDRLANVKRKLRKILSDRENRTIHRHHAFNLRQLSNYINYEDLSSACSDRSYQKLLDDYGNKTLICVAEKFKDEVMNNFEIDLNTIYREAILSQSNGQIYLLDYGLASKFLDSDGKHKDFVMDARKAHDGTLEYSSRDSHIGAHSRRSDLETLGYNMLDWLTGTLPWKTTEVLAEPDLVHALKKNFMSDIKSLLKSCFKTEFYPQFMEKYLQHITSLDYTEKPDYDYCRNLFRGELIRNGFIFDKEMNLNFAEPITSPMGRNKLCYSKRFGKKNTPPDFLARNGIKKAYERENVCSLENDLKLELVKRTLNISSDGMRKPCTSRNFFISDADLIARLKKSLMPHDIFGKKLSPKNLRSKKKCVTKCKQTKRHKNNLGKFGNFMGSARQFTWAEILAGNPEDIIRKERYTVNNKEDEDFICKYKIRKLSNASYESNVDTNIQSPLMQRDYLHGLNPTYAMREVLANFRKKVSGKGGKEHEESALLEGYTPIMIRLHNSKIKKKAKEELDILNQNLEQKELEKHTRCTRSMSGIVTGKNTVSKLTKKKNNDNDDANIVLVTDSQVNSTESKNQIATRRTKRFVNKNEIKSNVTCSDGETENNSCVVTSRNCDDIRTRKAKSVASKKEIKEDLTFNNGKTLETNCHTTPSKKYKQTRIRRAKNVANKNEIKEESTYSIGKTLESNGHAVTTAIKSNDPMRTRRAQTANKKEVNMETNSHVISAATKSCDRVQLRSARSVIDKRHGVLINGDVQCFHTSFKILPTAVKRINQVRTLRARSLACNKELKNVFTSNNGHIKILETESVIMPATSETDNHNRTRRAKNVPKKKIEDNVKTSKTNSNLVSIVSKSIDPLGTYSTKSVARKKVKVHFKKNNCDVISNNVQTAYSKCSADMPARITRSTTNNTQKQALESAKKRTKPRAHTVASNRRRLRSSKRKHG